MPQVRLGIEGITDEFQAYSGSCSVSSSYLQG